MSKSVEQKLEENNPPSVHSDQVPQENFQSNGNRRKKKRGGPGYKGTAEQIEQRVDFVADLVAQHFRFSEIKRRVRRKFGDFSARQIAEYVSRAKIESMEASKETKEDVIAASKAFNRSVLRNPKATIDQKQKSDVQICNLAGVYPPKQMRVAGEEGGAPITLTAASVSVHVYLPEKRTVEDSEPKLLTAGNGGNGHRE